MNIEHIRHSLAHLLAAAVLKKYPKAKLGIGPTIENGFYYDFEVPHGFSPDDLKEFEAEMRHQIKEGLKMEGEKITPAKAKIFFKNQPFKLELIKDFIKEKKDLSIYSLISSINSSLKTINYFSDLCRGGHVDNTNEINPEAFKLTHTAGAYWKGDEKQPQLQRIYGVAFSDKDELNNYLKMREEALKRDHKKLGPELDLFIFSPLVGPGLPLWTPRGTLMRDLLDSFVFELRNERGYVRVDIPHITKKELYEKSGHWDKFKDELFKVKSREGHEFAMKPMNCPHHIQIYARKQWSYRELPQRYASTTKVYRDEQSGEIGGLSRVRAITQDDAHVFCRKSQISEEMSKIWDMIEIFYKTFGFELSVRLSLRNPKEPKKYLGTPAHWDESEETLRKLAKSRKVDAPEALGEAAFYGPKIDFIAKDSIGRKWQVATIQLDMNQPERFDLTCISEDGKPERIVMIHAAIMGSIERFMAVLIEHTAGIFPLWLAPVQAQVLAISDKQINYATKVLNELLSAGIRAELTQSNITLGKRIREAQIQKIPYVLVVGDKEIQTNSVAVRNHKRGDEGTMPIKECIKKLQEEIAKKEM
ncbi:MAG: threonine--tRNA ligase [bacterium]|nr:threonine--tRNA ligase [bacterium]